MITASRLVFLYKNCNIVSSERIDRVMLVLNTYDLHGTLCYIICYSASDRMVIGSIDLGSNFIVMDKVNVVACTQRCCLVIDAAAVISSNVSMLR
ncbi:hypothetical protein DSUL_170048 [Desulfovibrionales bacterium]